MHRLRPLQNYHFGSNIKFAKEVAKTTIQPDNSCCMGKKRLQETMNTRKMRPFQLKIDKNGQYAKAIVRQCAAGLIYSNSLELDPCCWRKTSKVNT